MAVQRVLVMTRVLVVDDHGTFAEMLAGVLDGEPDLGCVGHAHNAALAVDMYAELKPDVVIMNVELTAAVDGGLVVTRALLDVDPGARVVLFAAHASGASVVRAINAGACGLVAKAGRLEQLLSALRAVRSGRVRVYPGPMSGLVPVQGEAVLLTGRERDVLSLMGQGMDVRTIAAELQISVHTCRDHVKEVLGKLGAHSQLEAVVLAVRKGMIVMELAA